MCLYAILSGLFIDIALSTFFNVNMTFIANKMILYFLIFWSGIDILIRIQIYFPIFPYLMTPISRQRLALFYQMISIFGKINPLLFIFMITFWLKNFLLKGISFAWMWLLLFLLLSTCFHLMTNLFRMSLRRHYLPMLCILLFVVVLVAMEWHYHIPTLSVFSAALFEAVLKGAIWPMVIVLIVGTIVLYISTSQIIHALYIDDTILFRPRNKISEKITNRSFMDSTLSFEWKLIRRNKRTRTLFIIIPYMTFYGIYLVITFDAISDMSNIIEVLNLLFGLLITPFFTCMLFIGSSLNFRSSFYDGLMSRPLLVEIILNNIFYISNVIILGYFGIISLVFIIMQNFIILPLAIYLLLYSLGIKYIIPYTWIFEARRIELNDNIFGNFNFQFGQNWWISALCGVSIIFLPPLLIAFLPGIHYGGMIMGTLGLAGFLLRFKWINLIAKNLEKNRYVLMEEFRKG